ncbi:MAG: hypothetical protein NVSMB5_20370 [Candidatus Velthaea sp.]
MTAASLIAVGASAGGIEALRTLIPNLPSGLPGAVAVVVHRMPVEEDKRLTRVLRVHSSLPVSTVTDGMKIEAGHVYVCPAGVHLVAQPEYFRLDRGPSENGYRPSIDVLFRSTAEAFCARGAGVVLSGLLDDGTAGLASIKAHGGYALVQDPSDALYGDMPRSAIENVHVDAIGTPKALAQLIDDFARAQELGVPQAGGPRARSQPRFSHVRRATAFCGSSRTAVRFVFAAAWAIRIRQMRYSHGKRKRSKPRFRQLCARWSSERT